MAWCELRYYLDDSAAHRYAGHKTGSSCTPSYRTSQEGHIAVLSLGFACSSSLNKESWGMEDMDLMRYII